MNDDELLRELQALQPREVSAELKERIASRLAEGERVAPRAQRKPWGAWMLGLGALAGAGLAAAWLWPAGIDVPRHETIEQAGLAGMAERIGDERLPSIWAYRQAMGSEAELDRLLTEHAASGGAAGAAAPTPDLHSLEIFTRAGEL